MSPLSLLRPSRRGAVGPPPSSRGALLRWTFIAVALPCIVLSAPAVRLHRLDPGTPAGLQELLSPGRGVLPIVSGHRGGAWEDYPENCIATFERTLAQTYAMFEIDPRYTKDRAVVVHHDPTLDRTTTGSGRLADFTLEEVRRLRLRDLKGRVTEHRMHTLDEVIEWARGKAVLVLDQKDVPAIERLRIIERHRAEGFVMMIVGSYRDVQEVHRANPNVMMEIFIANMAKAEEFGRLGVPWRNVVPFLGHQPPGDPALYAHIHRQGARCIVGTSRNLDRQLLTGRVDDLRPLEPDYRAILGRGADIIETDLPALLGPLLHRGTPVPAALKRHFRRD